MLEIRNVIARSIHSEARNERKEIIYNHDKLSNVRPLIIIIDYRDDLRFHVSETKCCVSFFFFFFLIHRFSRRKFVERRKQRAINRDFRGEHLPPSQEISRVRTYFNLFQIFVRSMHQQRLAHIHYAKQLQIHRGRFATLARG